MELYLRIFITSTFILALRCYFLKEKSKSKYNDLQNTCAALNSKVTELQNELDKKETNRISYQETEARMEADIFAAPARYYNLKLPFSSCNTASIMTVCESSMYYYINTALDALIPDAAERKKYFVFPQVTLHSIISMHPGLRETSLEYKIAHRSFVAKSIDFLICTHSSMQNSYKAYYTDHFYTPVLAIEIDGLSHLSPSVYGDEKYANQQKRDYFLKQLFQDLKLPFIQFVPKSVQEKADSEKAGNAVYGQQRKRLYICKDDGETIKMLIEKELF